MIAVLHVKHYHFVHKMYLVGKFDFDMIYLKNISSWFLKCIMYINYNSCTYWRGYCPWYMLLFYLDLINLNNYSQHGI